MKKNMIVAALLLFLVAVLFMGAASTVTMETLVNTTDNTVYVGMTINSTNSTSPGDV